MEKIAVTFKDLLENNKVSATGTVPLLCKVMLTPTEVVASAQLKKLSRGDIKILKNEQLARSKPLSWLKMAISTVVQDFEGYPVSKVLPGLSLNDGLYLLFAAHVYNFGTTIKGVQYSCESCLQQSSIVIDLGALTLRVDTAMATQGQSSLFSTDTFQFDLQVPISYTFKDQTHQITSIQFRHVTLQDAIKYESVYKPNFQSNYLEQVYADCIISIQTSTGETFEGSTARMIGLTLLTHHLSVLDGALLEGVFADRPAIEQVLSVDCPACSVTGKFTAPFFYLFPQRLEA